MSEPQPTTKFRYYKADFDERDTKRGKKYFRLARTDIMHANVQIVREGGENNLHSHKYLDGFWMVLKGRARFYGPENAVIGEFGPNEGIVIPRGTPYWFEKAGADDLELLQVESHAISIPVNDEKILKEEDRINHEPKRPNQH